MRETGIHPPGGTGLERSLIQMLSLSSSHLSDLSHLLSLLVSSLPRGCETREHNNLEAPRT